MPVALAAPDPFSDPHPPRPPPKTRMPVTANPYNRDIADAVRDTVHVRNHSTTDYSPRRVGRSQTATNPPAKHPSGRRSHSQDSGMQQEKPKQSKTRGKKGSQHADVIDRLDFTGVGPMFHHDGPFDACAPSRNKHPRKAPMAAWSPGPDQSGAGPYPSADAYDAFSSAYEQPKKKVDAIAEAWGIHEPEPFEEFFAGGGARGDTPSSSIYNGREGRSAASRRRETHDDSLGRSRRRNMPPPQPIFVPDAHHDDAGGSPAVNSGLPKRSKSLMHRIRKMRESPNVPVDSEYDQQPPSPSSPNERSARPTHRAQNSFLGRFASRTDEPFVLVDAHTNKDLPSVPSQSSPLDSALPTTGYFDEGHGTRNPSASPGGGGLARKTSLMKKMKGVVRR